jgi:preprotein translocase subunit YajC
MNAFTISLVIICIIATAYYFAVIRPVNKEIENQKKRYANDEEEYHSGYY